MRGVQTMVASWTFKDLPLQPGGYDGIGEPLIAYVLEKVKR